MGARARPHGKSRAGDARLPDAGSPSDHAARPRRRRRIPPLPRVNRVPNMMKHVCVAARIGEGKAPGEANSYSIGKTSNAAVADSGCNPKGLARVLAHNLVASHLLRMTKLRVPLRVLSQNHDSASRVSLC